MPHDRSRQGTYCVRTSLARLRCACDARHVISQQKVVPAAALPNTIYVRVLGQEGRRFFLMILCFSEVFE